LTSQFLKDYTVKLPFLSNSLPRTRISLKDLKFLKLNFELVTGACVGVIYYSSKGQKG
jgi:hypothetical protein